MLVSPQDRVHSIERRWFDADVRRHFFGVVDAADDHAMRTTGYAFVYDSGNNTHLRSATRRTRIVPLAVSGYIINVVDPDTEVENVRYEDNEAGRLCVTDGRWWLDVNEFGRMR